MVMIVYVEDCGDEYRYITKPSAPGAHIVYRGDDVKPGKTVLKAGRLLRAQDIGVMAALGYEYADVRKKPRVGIISTGDELVKVNDTPKGAQVRDINSYMLYAGIIAAGAEPVMYGICPDDYETLKQTVKQAALNATCC
jgi:molybdopterin molybdotransferase